MVKRDFIRIGEVLSAIFRGKKLTLNKVVIFGSYAKQTQRPDSDIDLIIVSRDFRGKDLFERVKLMSGVHNDLVDQINKPFDILYYSDQEWKAGRGLVLSAAKKEGKVIFG